METFIADGRIVGLALAMVLVELVILTGYFLRTGRGYAPSRLLLKLAPGACLMLALGAALRGSGNPWIALWLSAAGITHAADLWRGWPR